ncbi:MAG: AbrB/MazE/SpoVT family DNA-binding domain-containing protein [Thermoplasmatota archaeon]
MIEKKVLKKGQIVIPKDIRDLLGIHEGDKVRINIGENNIIISKEGNISEKLKSMAKKHDSEMSVKEIKDKLKKRYEV